MPIRPNEAATANVRKDRECLDRIRDGAQPSCSIEQGIEEAITRQIAHPVLSARAEGPPDRHLACTRTRHG